MTDAAIERLCERLDSLSALEPGWYANVGKRTGEQCCAAMRDAAALIRSQAERVKALEGALELWESGRRGRGVTPNGHPCVMDYPEDPNAEIRDGETGEVIFPARKAPFRLIEGACVCVSRGDGPEGCGICNETGEPALNTGEPT